MVGNSPPASAGIHQWLLPVEAAARLASWGPRGFALLVLTY